MTTAKTEVGCKESNGLIIQNIQFDYYWNLSIMALKEFCDDR